RSVDLPTPAIPWTKTTSGPPSSSVSSRAAFSAVRPNISADRSSTSSRIVRLTRASSLKESMPLRSGWHLREPAGHARRFLEHVEVDRPDACKIRVGRNGLEEVALHVLLHRLTVRPGVQTPVGVCALVREPDLRDH